MRSGTSYSSHSGCSCRTSDCLDSLYANMGYGGGVTTLDSDLAEAIYNRVRDYHMLKDEKDEVEEKEMEN